MAKVERFEELMAWKKARALTASIYQVTKAGSFSKDFGLSGQIQRATVSVMSNIAEGFERASLSEFSQFLSVAKASCGEVRSQLYIALDVGYLTQSEFDNLLAQAEEVSRIISALRASIERKKLERKTSAT